MLLSGFLYTNIFQTFEKYWGFGAQNSCIFCLNIVVSPCEPIMLYQPSPARFARRLASPQSLGLVSMIV